MRKYEELFGYSGLDEDGTDLMVLSTFVKDEDIDAGKIDNLSLSEEGRRNRKRLDYTEENVRAEYMIWWKDCMISIVMRDGEAGWKYLTVLKMFDWMVGGVAFDWMKGTGRFRNSLLELHIQKGKVFTDIAEHMGWQDHCPLDGSGHVEGELFDRIFKERLEAKMVDLEISKEEAGFLMEFLKEEYEETCER